MTTNRLGTLLLFWGAMAIAACCPPNDTPPAAPAPKQPTVFRDDSTQEDVVRWWNSDWVRPGALGLKTWRHVLGRMVPRHRDGPLATYLLHRGSDGSVVLDVPLATPVDEDPEPGCLDNLSVLRIEGQSRGLRIPLNPHCNEVYGPEEVNITLFWIGSERFPLVEVVTNGPACVPARLCAFDSDTGAYVQVAEQCGG